MNKTSVSVFRNAQFEAMGCDCSGNGLTHNVESGLLFWNCEPSEAIDWCKENGYLPELQFIIHPRTLWGEDHSYAEPLIKPTNVNQCFGGNFIYTSNGNFFKFEGEITNRPVPVHDRFETWEEAEGLSI